MRVDVDANGNRIPLIAGKMKRIESEEPVEHEYAINYENLKSNNNIKSNEMEEKKMKTFVKENHESEEKNKITEEAGQ